MSADPPRRALVVEAIATGLFLGLAQVGLGFALLTGAGASSLLFFALTAIWLAGGALFAVVIPARADRGVLGAALIAIAAARIALGRFPYGVAPTALGLGAGAIAGGYAGVFLRERARLWGAVGPLLFHENNGFVAGIAAGGALLLVSAHALDAAAGLFGLGLLGWSAARRG